LNTGLSIPGGWIDPYTLSGSEAGQLVVAGFSGGADSTAVLDILVKSGIPVIAVHINHMIRGDEAVRDAEFCKARAEAYGIGFRLFEIDIPALAKAGRRGLEETARDARYSAFASVMKETGARLLVTAHNADDNAETVLFNISRGCSAKGGCGIPPVRDFPEGNGLVVRPALKISKAELLAHCKENGLEYMTDSSNSDTAYSRNRIRKNVIPELTSLNPGFLRAVSSFSEQLRADCEYLDGEAARFLSSHPVLRSKELAELPRPVASRVIASAAGAAGASPERRHIEAILNAAAAGESFAVTLPGSINASIDRKGILSFVFDPRVKKTRPGTEEAKEKKNNPHIY